MSKNTKKKTSFEIAAEQMLLEGADRVETGDVVELRPGYRVKLLSGWGAHDKEKQRLVCTGRVSVDWKSRKDDPVGDGAELVELIEAGLRPRSATVTVG